jgi:hypothetical protein
MSKPATAALIGLLIATAAAAETGWIGKAGDLWGSPAPGLSTIEGQHHPATGNTPFFAQVPQGTAAYGWRYSDAFPSDTPWGVGPAETPGGRETRDRR